MNISNVLQTEINNCPLDHKIEVGQYGQNMYYIDTDERISDGNQDIINRILLQNQAVGLIGGYFDDSLTICMISGLACKTLGYGCPEDFLRETDCKLINMTADGDDLEYIRSRLLQPQNESLGGFLKGKGGDTVSLRMSNTVTLSQTGRKVWYISIRRLGEMFHDSLTGGYNRHGFIHYITNLKESGVDLKELAIVSINIKGFKAINDLYGSEFGDTMLINAYQHFAGCKIKPIICARKEADKFLLLVKKENLDLDILPKMLKISYTYGDKKYYANCVCGIYYINDDETNVGTMIDCAKIAKENLEDAFIKPYTVFKPSMKSDYLNHTIALSQFEEALSKNEFRVYYQPVVDCKTNKVVSAEALIRWETENGVLSPAVFIPAFEENGCIVKLDEYVLARVIMHLRKKFKKGLPIVPVSVNLSRMDFFDNERITRLCKIFKQDSVTRRYVRFEITETSHLTVRERQEDFIEKIRSLDGMVYIDDFGIANSSLDMLAQYDFEILKLDMRFISAMVQNIKVRTLIETTIYMAHRMNMKVVAEGVETEEQLQLLQNMNCDYIQGYYFSKPLPQDEFEHYLMAHI